MKRHEQEKKPRQRHEKVPAVPNNWTIHTDTHDYRTKYVDNLKDDDGEALAGDLDYPTGILRLDRKRLRSEHWASVNEELIHSYADSRGIKWTETEIMGLAEYLTAIHKNNDWYPAKARGR